MAQTLMMVRYSKGWPIKRSRKLKTSTKNVKLFKYLSLLVAWTCLVIVLMNVFHSWRGSETPIHEGVYLPVTEIPSSRHKLPEPDTHHQSLQNLPDTPVSLTSLPFAHHSLDSPPETLQSLDNHPAPETHQSLQNLPEQDTHNQSLANPPELLQSLLNPPMPPQSLENEPPRSLDNPSLQSLQNPPPQPFHNQPIPVILQYLPNEPHQSLNNPPIQSLKNPQVTPQSLENPSLQSLHNPPIQSLHSQHAPPDTLQYFHNRPVKPQYLHSRLIDAPLPLPIDPNHPHHPHRYLIYRCGANDRMGRCGGLADTLKGMMTAYLVANLTGRVFKSHMIETPGCRFSDFIVPNRVNWSLTAPFHDRIAYQPNVSAMNYADNLNFHGQIRNMDFNLLPQMKSKFVYFKTNLDNMDEFRDSLVYQNKQQLSWMKNLTRDEINAAVFSHLFKLSPPLQNKMDVFLQRIFPSPSSSRGKLICAHVRMKGNPKKRGHFEDKDNILFQALPSIWFFLSSRIDKDNGASSKIFFMSDSLEAVARTFQQPFAQNHLVYSDGLVAMTDDFNVKGHHHHDQSGHGNCQISEKLVFDFFLLMRCDVLVISKSGVSRLAAYVRGSDVGLYCLVGRAVLPCKRHELKQVYKVLG